jgi:propionate catabolism operon transcriptional regulator
VRELENLLTRAAIYSGDAAGVAGEDWQAVFPEFGRMRQVAAVPASRSDGASGENDTKNGTGDTKNGPNGANPAATPARATPTREAVLLALDQAGGNRAKASRALGIGRTTLWRLLKG